MLALVSMRPAGWRDDSLYSGSVILLLRRQTHWKWNSVVKGIDFGAKRLNSHLASVLCLVTSLSLSYFICKLGILIVLITPGLVFFSGLNESN